MPEPTTWQDWKAFTEWYRATTGQWPRVFPSTFDLRKGNIPTPYLEAWNMWLGQGKPTGASFKELQRRGQLSQAELQQEIFQKISQEGTVAYQDLRPEERQFLEQLGWTLVDEQAGFQLTDAQKFYQAPTTTAGTAAADPNQALLKLQQMQLQGQELSVEEQRLRNQLLQQQLAGGRGAGGIDMRTALQIARANQGVGRQPTQPTAEQWEQMRQEIMQALQPSPRNWLSMELLRNLPNPYEARMSPADIYEEAREAAKTSASAAKSARSRLTELIETDAPQWQIDLAKATIHEAKQDEVKLERFDLARIVGKQIAQQGGDVSTALRGITDSEMREQAESGFYATRRPSLEGGFEIGKPERPKEPKGVPLPAWLAAITGYGERFTGERRPITTPSAQQFQQLSPTQQAMWGGLVERGGIRTEEDIFAQMQKMLPEPRRTLPTRPRRQQTFV